MALFVPGTSTGTIAISMMVVAQFVNDPHFAYSYQIFYRAFVANAGRTNPDPVLRLRYLFAGVLVPTIFAAILAIVLARGDLRLLGLCGNAMAFLVGWHYVKQGYGILMVDAALKRRFFSPREKGCLRVNAYVVWLASWITGNMALGHAGMFGVEYVLIAFPPPVLWVAWSAAAIAAVVTGWMLVARWRSGSAMPTTGLVAYAVSLYCWQLFVVFNPVWLLVVPALYSLQYLAVVWRFEINRAKDAADATARAERSVFPNVLGRVVN